MENTLVKSSLLLLLITLSSFASLAQKDAADEMFTAKDKVIAIQTAAVKSGAVAHDHAIIIDGIIISDEFQLTVALEGVYANSIMDYTVLDHLKAKQLFDGKKVGNGAILLVLDEKAHRRFSKNMRKFEKKFSK